jgi:hypothetical protein
MTVVLIQLCLNTDQSRRALLKWKLPQPSEEARGQRSNNPCLELRRKVKAKLGLRPKVKRLFLDGGLELDHDRMESFLENPPTTTVSIHVSLGEDYGGTISRSEKSIKAGNKESKKEREVVRLSPKDFFVEYNPEHFSSSLLPSRSSSSSLSLSSSSSFSSPSPSSSSSSPSPSSSSSSFSSSSSSSCGHAVIALVPHSIDTSIRDTAQLPTVPLQSKRNPETVAAPILTKTKLKFLVRELKQAKQGASTGRRLLAVAQLYEALISHMKKPASLTWTCSTQTVGKASEGPQALQPPLRVLEYVGHPPEGFTCSHVGASPLLALARAEVQHVFAQMQQKLSSSLTAAGATTNLRFTLTTADFARNAGSNPWPMLLWSDPRLRALTSLLESITAQFQGPVALCSSPRLNAIVRLYRAGDVIGFHTDRQDYTEEIFGLVLENAEPQRGLAFFAPHDPRGYFMAHETPGACFCLRGAARWNWLHGYAAAASSKPAPRAGGPGVSPQPPAVRVSVSFRFFKDASMAPEYNEKNNI